MAINRDAQLVSIQRIRDFGVFNSERDISIIPLVPKLGSSQKIERKGCKNQREQVSIERNPWNLFQRQRNLRGKLPIQNRIVTGSGAVFGPPESVPYPKLRGGERREYLHASQILRVTERSLPRGMYFKIIGRKCSISRGGA